MGTLKPQSNTDSNTVQWPLMGGLLHLVQREGGSAVPQPAQAPPPCTKCNSPLINCQCINFMLFDMAL